MQEAGETPLPVARTTLVEYWRRGFRQPTFSLERWLDEEEGETANEERAIGHNWLADDVLTDSGRRMSCLETTRSGLKTTWNSSTS